MAWHGQRRKSAHFDSTRAGAKRLLAAGSTSLALALAAAFLLGIPSRAQDPTPACRADVSKNGVVDQADLDLVRASYRKKAGDAGFNPAVDFDDNGLIDLWDLTFVSRLYGQTCEVVANHNPAITSQPVTTALLSSPYQYQVLAGDVDSDPLTYQLTAAPEGMTIDGAGMVRWLPSGSPASFLVTIVVSDGRGGSATQNYQLAVVDATPPFISLSGPSRVLPGGHAVITATATDNIGVAAVVFEVNGMPSPALTAPPYQQTIDVPADAAAGTLYDIKATAVDAAGNPGSAAISLVVDARPDTQDPVVHLAVPAEASPGTQVRLAAAATDNVGVASVTFSMGGAFISTDTLPPFEALALIPPGAAVGSAVAFAAEATDFSGNKGQDSGSTTVVAEPDTTPPQVALTIPPTVILGTSLAIGATATDAGGIQRVEFFVNGGSAGTVLSPPYEVAYPVPADAVPGSRLRVEARAFDFAGLETSAFGEATVASGPANRPPVAQAGGPYAAEAGTEVRFSSSGTMDPDGDPLTLTWEFGDGTAGSGSSPIHVYLTPGTYVAVLSAADGRGGLDTSAATVVVVAPPDREPPIVVLAGPTEALPGTQATFTAQVADNTGVVLVTFEVNGADPTQSTAEPHERTITIPAIAAPGAVMTVRATARDGAGNVAAAERILTVASIPDIVLPVVTINAPPQAVAGGSIRLTATASDNVGLALLRFLVDGVLVASSAAPPFEATFQVPAGAMVGSNLTAVAEAFDFAGNRGEARAAIAIAPSADTQPPAVTLAAPAEAQQGATITLSATATDNVGVASVAFFVDDARIATVVAPPYRADYRIPADLPPGRLLRVEARAVDFSDLPATASAQVRVAEAAAGGLAVVTGEVYDDTTGLPIENATAALVGNDDQGVAYGETATTDAHGRYVLRANPGNGVVRVTKAAWSRVDRPVTLTVDLATELFDARLTPTSQATQALDPVFGGTVAGGGATLTVPGGALRALTTLTLTTLGAQGIQGLLPPGWTPIAVADLLPHGVPFSGGATLAVPNAGAAAAGTPVVLATWDEAVAAWMVIAAGEVPAGAGGLQAAIPSSGQFAWLLADTQPAAPPAPAIGAALAGLAPASIPDPAAGVVDPQPRVIFYQPGVRSDVAGSVTAAGPLSSGAPALARIAEAYSFLSGDEIRLEPLVQDIVLYQRSGAPGTLSAAFPVTPSLVFDPLALDNGVITVELHAPGSEPRGFTTIGSGGGTLTAATGQSVQFPAGATLAAIPAGLARLTLASTGLVLPAGVEFVDALLVSFPGGLLKPAVLSIPRPAQVTAADQILIVRAQEIGGATRLVLVGVGAVAGDRIVSTTALGIIAGALEGPLAGGRYLFLRPASPVGFVAGTVRGTDAGPFVGALVSTNTLPIVALSRAHGAYALASSLGAATFTARDLARSDTGVAPAAIPLAGAVVPLDLQLVAEAPHVVSVSPADGADNVLLSAPVIITFSKPIDPASVSGANAGNVLLTAPDLTPVVGAISLSAANTVVTFRAASPLVSNTRYTLTVSQAVVDAAGRPMAAPFTSSFSSLDTTPPPVPPAGSISAALPDAAGNTTITATQGTAGPRDSVTVVNVTRKTTTPVLVDPNGGFVVIVPASITDEIRLHIVDPAGNGIDVELPRFQQFNADGSLSASVNASGGRIDGPGGVAVGVPAGAFPDGAVVTIKPIAPADFPIQLTDEQKTIFSMDGGVSLDFGGATPAKYLDVSIAPLGGETANDQWVVGQVVEVYGKQLLSVVDTARLIDGRITTSSPPCPGVTAAGTYGFVKSGQPVGVNYAQAYVTGEMQADFKIFMLSMAIPWTQFSTTISQFVCYPVLTANVTIGPNKARIVIEGKDLTPVDRKIKVTNSTRDRVEYFPRNVAEYVILVTGGPKDAYRVDAIGADGNTLKNLAGISFGPTQGDKVTMRIDPTDITVPVMSFKVTNFSRGDAQETIAVALEPFEVLATGSENDTYLVEAIPDVQNPTKREVPNTVLASAAGTGNLVVQAVTGSIDPNRAEMDEAHQSGPARTSVSLTSDTGTDFLIPDTKIVNGGFAVAFDGDDTATYTLTVYYDSRAPYSITIPKFELSLSDPATGEVIKVIRAHAPPRYEPQNLGMISDDRTPPLLLSGPARVSNFDPAGSLTFSFSEPMNAASVKENLVITDSKNNRLKGSIELSNQNMVVTFVPSGALRLAETYKVTFKGGTAQGQAGGTGVGTGMQDPAGNPLPEATLVIKTFTPKLLNTLTRDVPVKDIAIRRIPRNDPPDAPGKPPATIVYVTAGYTPGHLWAADVTDVTKPQWYGSGPNLPTSQQRVTILPDAFFSTSHDPPLDVIGPLAITSSFNTSDSNLSFLYLAGADDPVPLLVGGKTLTINPDLATGANQRNRTFAIGYAKGVAALKTDTGVAAYAAVEHVGVMAASVELNSPARSAGNVILEGNFPGDFTDIASYKKVLLALSRSDQSLTVLDPGLTAITQRWLNYAPRRIRVVEDLKADLDGDGYISPGERFDLAVLGCDNAVVLVDIRDPANPKDIGIIEVPGIVRELDVDRDRRRVFAGVDQTSGNDLGPAFVLIDISDPTRVLPVDDDNDGIDDRIVWRENHPAGFNGLKLDEERGLLYVTGASGLEIWSVYDTCCDLGVDMDAQPSPHWSGKKTETSYESELAAIQKGISRGLKDAAADCAGFDITKMRMHESGSSACLWAKDPAKTCGSNYQPGVSDHDFSVFLPDDWYTQDVRNPFDKPGDDDREKQQITLAMCTIRSLSEVFTDGHTGQPRPVDGFLFADISFLPNWIDDFKSARYRLDVTPPTGFGDQSNDMALGRQNLIMKHMTEARGVVLEDYPEIGWKETDYEDTLDKYRRETKIPLLEGYEWHTLMQFMLAKAKAYVRIKGSSDESSAFHDFFVHQLHLAGKAAIRATLARMDSNELTRDLVLSFARTRPAPGQQAIAPVREGIPIRYLWEVDGAACLQYEEDPVTKEPTDPTTWNAKVCGSMEEYVASTAIRTLLLPKDDTVYTKDLFTMDEVLAIQRFYRVKADEEQIRTDAEADEFIAIVHKFIQAGLEQTKPAYDTEMAALQASDPARWKERTDNLEAARKKTYGDPESTEPKKQLGVLRYGAIQVVPHVFSIGYRNFSELRLAMYVSPASGTRPEPTEFMLDLMGGEHVYPAWKHTDTGALLLDEVREAEPIFQLVVDQTKDLGQKGEVAFSIDLPKRKAREADRENNIGGFFYYIIDAASSIPVPPLTAAKVAPPSDLVANYPDMLDADKECTAEPGLVANQVVVIDGIPLEPPVVLSTGETVTLRLIVGNRSTKTIDNVVVCSTLQGACVPVGSLGAGETAIKEISYTATSPSVVESTAIAYGDGASIFTSAPFDVVAGCQPWVLTTFEPDPNPTGDQSTIMAGGTSYRHYRFVRTDPGPPSFPFSVNVEASHTPGQTYAFTTDANGVIGQMKSDGQNQYFEPGIAIPFPSDSPEGVVTVQVKDVNGQQPLCGTLPQYTVKVKPFEFKQALKAGSEISAEFKLDKVAALGFEFGGGLALSFDATKPSSPTFSALDVLRSTRTKVGGKLEVKSPFKFYSELGGASMGVGQGVRGAVYLGWTQFDTHRFDWRQGGLSPADKRALTGLAIATASGAYATGPQAVIPALINKYELRNIAVREVLDWLGLGQYEAHKVSQGWTLTLGGSAGFKLLEMKTGPTPAKIDGSVNIGGSASAAFTIGFNNRLDAGGRVTLIEPNLGVTGSFQMSGQMTAGAEDAKKQIDEDPATKGLPDGFKKRMKSALETQLKKLDNHFSNINVEANIRFSMAFAPDDPEHPFEPKRLDMTIFANKPFGLVGTGGGQYENKGRANQYSLTYSVSRREDIKNALKRIAEYNGVLDEDYRKIILRTDFKPLRSFNANAAEVAKTLMNVVRLLLFNGEYRDAIDSGEGIVDKKYMLGGLLGIKLSFDSAVNHTREQGVIRAGQLFKLDDYTNVSVPVLDSNDIWSKIVVPAFQESDPSVQSNIPPTHTEPDPATGGGRLTTRGTELRVANSNDLQQVETLAALPFTEVQGPVAAAICLPSDISGPVGKPHYGLNGFADLVGQGPLSAPAQLTLSYQGANIAGIDENSIAMYRFNEGRRHWDPVPGTLDLANKTVSATISELATYTLGPAMPAGTLTWSIASSSLGDPDDPNAVSTIRLVSNTVLLNTGSAVPADTVFHVVSALPDALAWEPIPFGEILTPDVLPGVDGVQVRVNASGQVELEIRLPASASDVRIVAFSDIGTAMSDETIAIR